jgi:hypothetical protein
MAGVTTHRNVRRDVKHATTLSPAACGRNRALPGRIAPKTWPGWCGGACWPRGSAAHGKTSMTPVHLEQRCDILQCRIFYIQRVCSDASSIIESDELTTSPPAPSSALLPSVPGARISCETAAHNSRMVARIRRTLSYQRAMVLVDEYAILWHIVLSKAYELL